MRLTLRPSRLMPDGSPVLLGYDPNLLIFAGFDFERHSTFRKHPPSAQIDIGTVHKALQTGLPFDLGADQEFVIGLRPDHLLPTSHPPPHPPHAERVVAT